MFVEFIEQFAIYFLAIFLGLTGLIYGYFQYSYTYWEKKKVPYIKPKFPLGNNPSIGLETGTFGIETKQWHDHFRKLGEKFGGVWTFANKGLVIVDPEYIRDVFTKDFDYFNERGFYYNSHDIIQRNLFMVGGETWKHQKTKMSPAFTSAKMKLMFEELVQCSDIMIDLLGNMPSSADVPIKQILEKFTMDVVGCTMFGLNFNCLLSDNPQLREIADMASNIPLMLQFKTLLARICPKLALFLRITIPPLQSAQFFIDLIEDSIKYRKEQGIKKIDFVQLLMDIEADSKTDNSPLKYEDIKSNLYGFFFAGFDTSSRTMHYALYELATYPDIQDKTREEILRVLKKHNGKITYEAVQEMQYLRQVIDETLRIWPPLMGISRQCVKDYNLRDTNVKIEKGTTVILSVIGMHRDPEYFPNPEKFDPDRFSSENKHLIRPYSYMPFGEGPRLCIGRRFGLMQSSVGLIRILKDFKVDISPKTEVPLKIKHKGLLVETNNLYLKLTKLPTTN